MKIDIPVSQPYRVDIAPGLLDDLGRYVSSGTAALVVTEEHVAPLLLERACRALRAAGVRAVPASFPPARRPSRWRSMPPCSISWPRRA